LSARARVNAMVFLASVMLSVFLMPLLGASVLRATVKGHSGAASFGAGKAWVLIGLGLLLAVFALANFRKRADTMPPPVFGKIADMGLGGVLVLSLVVVWFNPVNAVVLLSVGSQAASTDVSTAPLLLSLAVFTVLATIPFIAVVWLLVCGGERARVTLERFRRWLLEHNRIIVAAVLGLLGLALVGQGVTSLRG